MHLEHARALQVNGRIVLPVRVPTDKFGAGQCRTCTRAGRKQIFCRFPSRFEVYNYIWGHQRRRGWYRLKAHLGHQWASRQRRWIEIFLWFLYRHAKFVKLSGWVCGKMIGRENFFFSKCAFQLGGSEVVKKRNWMESFRRFRGRKKLQTRTFEEAELVHSVTRIFLN